MYILHLSQNSWNFLAKLVNNVNKIFLETFIHSLVEYMKYLRMLKLQFLNTNHKLLTKFTLKILFNFLAWYKVIT